MEHHVLLSIDPVATCGEAAALIGVHQQALCDVEYSFSAAKSISDGQDVLDEVWLRGSPQLVLVRLWVPGFARLPPLGERFSVMEERKW